MKDYKQVSAKYWISHDKYQFIVAERHLHKSGKKEGQPYYDDIRFYPEWSGVVGFLANECAKEWWHGDISRVQTAIDEMKTACNAVQL